MLWVLILLAGMTAVHERMTVAWLKAFEGRHVGRAIVLGMALEAGTWAPIKYLNATDSYWVPIACTVGAGLGIWTGLRRKSPGQEGPFSKLNALGHRCFNGACPGDCTDTSTSSTQSSTSPETECNGRGRLGGSIERKLLQGKAT